MITSITREKFEIKQIFDDIISDESIDLKDRVALADTLQTITPSLSISACAQKYILLSKFLNVQDQNEPLLVLLPPIITLEEYNQYIFFANSIGDIPTTDLSTYLSLIRVSTFMQDESTTQRVCASFLKHLSNSDMTYEALLYIFESDYDYPYFLIELLIKQFVNFLLFENDVIHTLISKVQFIFPQKYCLMILAYFFAQPTHSINLLEWDRARNACIIFEELLKNFEYNRDYMRFLSSFKQNQSDPITKLKLIEDFFDDPTLGESRKTDISTIKGLTLKNLNLTQVPDYPLSLCKELTYLDVSNNYLTSFEDLAKFSQLSTLKANENYPCSFKGLEHLTSLTELECNNSGLSTLKGFPYNLSNLRSLSLTGNQLTSMEDLPALPRLSTFFISENPSLVSWKGIPPCMIISRKSSILRNVPDYHFDEDSFHLVSYVTESGIEYTDCISQFRSHKRQEAFSPLGILFKTFFIDFADESDFVRALESNLSQISKEDRRAIHTQFSKLLKGSLFGKDPSEETSNIDIWFQAIAAHIHTKLPYTRTDIKKKAPNLIEQIDEITRRALHASF